MLLAYQEDPRGARNAGAQREVCARAASSS